MRIYANTTDTILAQLSSEQRLVLLGLRRSPGDITLGDIRTVCRLLPPEARVKRQPRPHWNAMTDAKPLTAPLAEHEDMGRWKSLPVWAQQELEKWRRDEAHQRGLADATRAELERTRAVLGKVTKAALAALAEETGIEGQTDEFHTAQCDEEEEAALTNLQRLDDALSAAVREAQAMVKEKSE
jgi:hypothetical protein